MEEGTATCIYLCCVVNFTVYNGHKTLAVYSFFRNLDTIA